MHADFRSVKQGKHHQSPPSGKRQKADRRMYKFQGYARTEEKEQIVNSFLKY